ncbi:MAG: D-glucuronyl C5-epimerase family protein [Gammaproteobacteria bacterium]|nr:D-glucuronyl C5-epimerase family protein [Gammaproteobacteria bacterium]
MANLIKNTIQLTNNYFIAPLRQKTSTTSFWYLSEPANIKTEKELDSYKDTSPSPFFLIDYRKKLKYTLKNNDDIIVLPYNKPIGHQINPEAAFQYALGLHDQHHFTQDNFWLNEFFRYVHYFAVRQTAKGHWQYTFDWYAAKAPWSSALAQARGAAVMLRAYLHSHDDRYIQIAKKAVQPFQTSIEDGGFLHIFAPEKCYYFEEYPPIPTGVINGFMSTLMCLWELSYWLQEKWLEDLWQIGIQSLEKMLPHYSTGWWSLYDLDERTPIQNVNSPRYHLLEIHYLQVLKCLSSSKIIKDEYHKRIKQYHNPLLRSMALGKKIVRKVLYK